MSHREIGENPCVILTKVPLPFVWSVPHVIYSSLGAYETAPQTASQSFWPFCTAFSCTQPTDTHAMCNVSSIGRIYVLLYKQCSLVTMIVTMTTYHMVIFHMDLGYTVVSSLFFNLTAPPQPKNWGIWGIFWGGIGCHSCHLTNSVKTL